MILFPLLLQLAAGMGNPGHLYRPSPDQVRIDRGFSMIMIDTSYIAAKPLLGLDRSGDCQMNVACEAMDKNGVRYRFDGDDRARRYVIAKTVRAADYLWKAIPALGIGQFRDKPMVMAAVACETRGAPFDCRAGDGHETCRLQLKPGRIEIRFDGDGRFLEASLIGYEDYP